MTTLVTGAAGFLGSHVARHLVARGEDVAAHAKATVSVSAAGAASTGTLKVGASLSMTGDFSDSGKAARRGYELWAETYATADIVAYDGKPMVKAGREFLLRKG